MTVGRERGGGWCAFVCEEGEGKEEREREREREKAREEESARAGGM